MDEDIIEIDQYSLDEEWVEQPKKFFDAAKQLADARRSLDEAKTELDVVRAEVDKDIRDDPASWDLPKVTEAAVANIIPTTKEYQHANKVVRNAKHKVDVLQAMVTALDHRKKALEKLVELHGQNYFATPTAKKPKDKEAMGEIVKKSVRRRAIRRKE